MKEKVKALRKEYLQKYEDSIKADKFDLAYGYGAMVLACTKILRPKRLTLKSTNR